MCSPWFNQRKIVYILSDNHESLVDKITHEIHQGVTLIEARGAYSGRQKQMLMTITNNLQLKHLEEKVFEVDPNALFIVENSFNVIGSNFGKRKISKILIPVKRVLKIVPRIFWAGLVKKIIL